MSIVAVQLSGTILIAPFHHEMLDIVAVCHRLSSGRVSDHMVFCSALYRSNIRSIALVPCRFLEAWADCQVVVAL